VGSVALSRPGLNSLLGSRLPRATPQAQL
jgi:hypothetical protein